MRTQAPKSLKSMEQMSITAAYDPAVLDQIKSMVNVNQLITVTFPDGSTWAFWGWLDEFTPGNHVEGEMPTANVVIQPSLTDASGDEIAPAYSAAS